MNENKHQIELTWFEDCVVLADTLNFSRAAALRNITQPAFSRRIQALEDWVGTPLFIRTTRGVQVTEAGQAFKNHALHLLRSINTAKINALEIAGFNSPTLIVSATHSISSSFFPGWIRKKEHSQDIEPLHLVSDTFSACEKMLIHGEAQFLLCYANPLMSEKFDPALFNHITVGQDLLLPVCKPIGKTGKPAWELKNSGDALPYLSYSSHSGLGMIMANSIQVSNITQHLKTKFTSDLAATLLGMTLAGDGIAWIPYSLIADYINNGLLVKAAPKEMELELPLEIKLYRPVNIMSRAAESLWNFFQNESSII